MNKVLPEDVTFVLFTYNEEARIQRAILNVIGFGRVLIVDNESSDRTLDIARQHGCGILINKNPGWVEDEITVARVKAAVKTDWIYWGFADEMIDRATMKAILEAVASGRYDIVNVARKNYYYGTFCGDLLSDRMNRVFRKNAIDFTGNSIHRFGRVVPDARIRQLPSKYFVHHFISNTANSYLSAIDRYTDIDSQDHHGFPGIISLLLSSLKLFAVDLPFRGGFKAGTAGCFLMCQTVYYRWLVAMKSYEKSRGLDRQAIEVVNDATRERILDGLK